MALCNQVRAVSMQPVVADYLLAIVHVTRTHPDIALGCSPRGALAMASLARAWAYLKGRDYVIPDDVRDIVVPTLGHRIMLAGAGGVEAREVMLQTLVGQIAVPR